MKRILGRSIAALCLVFWASVSAWADMVVSTSNTPSMALSESLNRLLTIEREALSGLQTSQLRQFVALPKGVDVETARFNRSWLDAQPVASGGPQWGCLTEALYFEARGESMRGIYGVAEVILNRVDGSAYPDTICEVVNQGTGRRFACQFTYTCDGRLETITEPAAYDRVGKIARIMMDGAPRNLTQGAQYYHTKAVNPRWSRVFERTTTIDDHHFYVNPVHTSAALN